MKLDVAVNETVLSNVGATGEFRIRNSAKAFKILSDGLYSNKIKAIIRELSCNALDSHVAAGNTAPFEVHLPTFLEPWFAVRDFGTGLDGEQVTNIYTTYFESTKTNSNDFIGALGLGSKSPFSYTENFTVTAIKAGTKRIYSAFINEMGVPSIAEMSVELTDEPNGVEVKFSVTDKFDYNTFQNESQNVFKWFKNKPVITGVSNFVIGEVKYKERDIVPGVHIIDENYHSRSHAVMGNIAYSMSDISEPQKHFGELAHLLECNLVIDFAIGELDFAASREVLSYVPLTIASIKRKLIELNDNLANHLTTKANAITCEWARADFLYKEFNTKLYKSAVLKYVKDTKFALFDTTNLYTGRKQFKFDVPDLISRGLSIAGFETTSYNPRTISASYRYDSQHNKIHSFEISVSPDVVIIVNDLKTGCVARARHHFIKSNKRKKAYVYCFSHTSDDLTVRQAEYDKLVKELHTPPTVIKASQLEKPIPAPRVATTPQGIMQMVQKPTRGYYNRSVEYTWEPFTGAIDPKQTYYYVCLDNFTPQSTVGSQVNINYIRNLMSKCGIASIAAIQILGVRKSRVKEIQGLKNWVYFEEKLKEEVLKVDDKLILSTVAANQLAHYSNDVYTSVTIANTTDAKSPYRAFVHKYAKLRKSGSSDDDSVNNLVTLCSMFGKTVQIAQVKAEIDNAKAALQQVYPMLKYVTDFTSKPGTITTVKEYINMIDKQV